MTDSSLRKVENDLIFTHLNTGNFETEFKFFPDVINKTKTNGVIVIDNYGFWSQSQQEIFNNYVSKNSNLFKMAFPSLQCVIIKF